MKLLLDVCLCLIGVAALAQELDFSPLLPPGERDTVAAARLGSGEIKQIFAEVEKTSFDAPDSWETELRLRRVPMAGGEGLLVRGTRLLCGGTGNCETWLLRRANGQWINLFAGEAPVVASLGFGRRASHGLPDLVATANLSAQASSYVVYVFDGRFYRAGECYEVTEKAGKKTPRKIPCK